MTTPRTLTVSTPEDVLALVLSVLGFQPAESVVMVTRTTTASFHARADLPAEPSEIREVAEHLAIAAEANHAREAIVVAYCEDPALADGMTGALVGQLEARGIAVELTLREHDGRWYAPGGAAGRPGSASEAAQGTAYDLAAHPFVLESRFRDREIYRDRGELAASLRGTAEQMELTGSALPTAAARLTDAEVVAEVGWFRERVGDDASLSAADVARIAVALGFRDVRDGVWMGMDRDSAARWRRRLKEVVRATPVELVVEPAALLAFASWLSGDGALAWCAVDLARSVSPDHTLASLVAQALEAAVPPTAWDPPTPEREGPQTG